MAFARPKIKEQRMKPWQKMVNILAFIAQYALMFLFVLAIIAYFKGLQTGDLEMKVTGASLALPFVGLQAIPVAIRRRIHWTSSWWALGILTLQAGFGIYLQGEIYTQDMIRNFCIAGTLLMFLMSLYFMYRHCLYMRNNLASRRS